jgi:hypothetical protein
MAVQNRLTMDKRSSLLCLFVGDGERKTFYTVGYRWFKDEAPLVEEKGRIRIRSKTGSGEIQVSRCQSYQPHFFHCQ